MLRCIACAGGGAAAVLGGADQESIAAGVVLQTAYNDTANTMLSRYAELLKSHAVVDP